MPENTFDEFCKNVKSGSVYKIIHPNGLIGLVKVRTTTVEDFSFGDRGLIRGILAYGIQNKAPITEANFENGDIIVEAMPEEYEGITFAYDSLY